MELIHRKILQLFQSGLPKKQQILDLDKAAFCHQYQCGLYLQAREKLLSCSRWHYQSPEPSFCLGGDSESGKKKEIISWKNLPRTGASKKILRKKIKKKKVGLLKKSYELYQVLQPRNFTTYKGRIITEVWIFCCILLIFYTSLNKKQCHSRMSR